MRATSALMFLARIDLKATSLDTVSLRQSIRQYGAVRLAATDINDYRENVFSKAIDFFEQDEGEKIKANEYSPQRAESIRNRKIPKQSTYWRNPSTAGRGSQDAPTSGPLESLACSVAALRKAWTPLRQQLIPVLFSALREGPSPETTVEHNGWTDANDTVGIHYYDPGQLRRDDSYFNPPHVDSGLFTVILLHSRESDSCLEIADLETTSETSSGAIGNDAVFKQVDFEPGDVIVMAGKELQRIYGRGCAPACVHRVRRPTLITEGSAMGRYSVAIFCSRKNPSQ